MEYKFRSLRSWKKSRYTRLSNYSPLSDTNDLGMPKRQKIFFQMNRVTSLSLIDAKASSFIHLLKLSVTTNNSFFYAGAVGMGPKYESPIVQMAMDWKWKPDHTLEISKWETFAGKGHIFWCS